MVAGEAAFGRARCLYSLAVKNSRDEEGIRSALSAIAVFLRDFPTSPDVGTARTYLDDMKTRIEKLYYDRAIFYDRLAHKPAAAVVAYRDFIAHFPSSEKTAAMEQRLADLQRQLEAQNEK
jgi:hypothetical protein